MKLSAGRDGTGRAQHGDTTDNIENLSPGLWLLAWLGSARAEVCQLLLNHYLTFELLDVFLIYLVM